MELSLQYRSPVLSRGCLCLFLLAGLLTTSFAQEEIDRIVATIDDEPITASDLRWHIRYRGFQVPSPPEERDALLRDILDQLINQRLIVKESSKTPFIQVTEAELQQFLEAYLQRFSSQTAYQEQLKELGMHESDFRDALYRQIVVNKFIELRFEPFIIVMPDEIVTYYREEYVPQLQDLQQLIPPLGVVEETIRQILTVQRTTEQLERWLDNTRQRARVNILLFRSPPTLPNIPWIYSDQIELLENPFSKRTSGNRE